MVAASWPLWIDAGDFPRVPFVRGWPELPAWVSWAYLGVIAASLAAGAIGRGGRVVIAAGLVALGFEILGDQNRLQAWIIQYAIMGLVLIFAPKPGVLRLARSYAIWLYLDSGFSKLDPSFVSELGPVFLRAAIEPLGGHPAAWPPGARTLAILAMPAWEIAVGLGLAWRRSRRLALAGAIAQHLVLILILAPGNLGHSGNVLVWNAAMAAENWFAFRAPTPAGRADGRLVAGVFGLALVVAVGERLGWCDSWPAHALYASHSERTDVFLHEDDLDALPNSARRWVGPPGPDPWRRLDLTGWSRDLRGAPIYPQGRVGNGVAEFLAARFGGVQPVRVVQWSRARFGDGQRDRTECVGLRAIRRHGDRYAINAHPAGLGIVP